MQRRLSAPLSHKKRMERGTPSCCFFCAARMAERHSSDIKVFSSTTSSSRVHYCVHEWPFLPREFLWQYFARPSRAQEAGVRVRLIRSSDRWPFSSNELRTRTLNAPANDGHGALHSINCTFSSPIRQRCTLSHILLRRGVLPIWSIVFCHPMRAS